MVVKPLLGSGELSEIGAKAAPEGRAASWLGGKIVFDHRRWTCREAKLSWLAPEPKIRPQARSR